MNATAMKPNRMKRKRRKESTSTKPTFKISSKTRLPHIGTDSFKELGFAEQLWLYNLYLHDPMKYKELVGVLPPDHDLAYVDDAIRFIATAPNVGAPSIPEDHSTFYFVRDFWTAYESYYKPTWYEESFSPVDELEMSHRRLFTLQLFTFPLLRVDKESARILRWLVKNLEGRDRADVFFHMVKLRTVKEYYEIETEWEDYEAVEDIWNAAIIRMAHYGTIQEINGDYPIIDEDNDLLDWLDDGTLSFLPMTRSTMERSYVPLVPTELYHNSQFYIRNWGFLTLQS